MSNDIDFKELWSRGKASAPDVSEILTKATKMNRKTRFKIWRGNIVLSLTILLMIFIWVHYQPQFLTTKIGLSLILIAIVVFLITTNQMLPLLDKANEAKDSREFLQQIIRIRHKQQFLNKTMLTGYFILLAIGISLYFIEYAGRGSLMFQLLAYGITFAWIIFNWVYIRKCTIKKQHDAINEIIVRLKKVKWATRRVVCKHSLQRVKKLCHCEERSNLVAIHSELCMTDRDGDEVAALVPRSQ